MVLSQAAVRPRQLLLQKHYCGLHSDHLRLMSVGFKIAFSTRWLPYSHVSAVYVSCSVHAGHS